MNENIEGTREDRDLALDLKRFLDLGQNEKSIARLHGIPLARVKALLKLVDDPKRPVRKEGTPEPASWNAALRKAKQIIREIDMASNLRTGHDVALLAAKRIDQEMMR